MPKKNTQRKKMTRTQVIALSRRIRRETREHLEKHPEDRERYLGLATAIMNGATPEEAKAQFFPGEKPYRMPVRSRARMTGKTHITR